MQPRKSEKDRLCTWHSVAAASLLSSRSDGARLADDFPREKFDEAGFVTIFDGKTLDGWHVSAKTGHSGASNTNRGGRWVVEDGAITGSQDIPGNGGLIITDKAYGDFEVALEMNNDFGPDSGLFLRSTEQGKPTNTWSIITPAGNLAGIYGEGLSGGISPAEFRFPGQGHRNQAARLPRSRCRSRSKIGPSCGSSASGTNCGPDHANPPKIVTWINGVRFMEFEDRRSASPTPAASPCKSTAAATTPSSSSLPQVRVKEMK